MLAAYITGPGESAAVRRDHGTGLGASRRDARADAGCGTARRASVGLRVAEACGLRTADVDFMRGIVRPVVQYPADELKSDMSRTPVPIPNSLALDLAAHVQQWPGETVLTDRTADSSRRGRWSVPSGPLAARWTACRRASGIHDLRHYLASLLIASGADVKIVQARLRHASAKTTLDTYGHLWPDRDDSTRAVLDAVMRDRADSVRTSRERTVTSTAGQTAMRRLDVVVELELVRVRAQADRVDLVARACRSIQVSIRSPGEHAALEQVLVVGLEARRAPPSSEPGTCGMLRAPRRAAARRGPCRPAPAARSCS